MIDLRIYDLGELTAAVRSGEITNAHIAGNRPVVEIYFGGGRVSLLYVMQAPREMLTPAQQAIRGTLMRCGLRPHGDAHGEVSIAWRDGPPSIADIAAHEASASVGRDLGAPWLRVLHGRDVAVRYLSAQGGVARFRAPGEREWIKLASVQEGAFGPWCPLVVPT